ncbi:flagellar basal body P-ring protein FlgI [Leptospirillum ferrooxidans]|jgi:flagellar P-ring protein precursor FlgI|uniref:Flagellar P-ring protein n=1 Tax=Leptospirillum ferrooxidans (strain C2-3) TaxID=1162668 RepID=I0IR76_LEPFC|nr:flagellar basal body P-ring protein FlgI [Leptospirillum ferrooxidans]BAM07775.1 putative flagellar P-ring protein [Leptospirillum ferrooxidans C2-3]
MKNLRNVLSWFLGICLIMTVVISLASPDQVLALRIEDIAHVEGVTDNPLVGYGLIVGLRGTGDTKLSPFTRQSLVSTLSRLGVNMTELQSGIHGHNVAAVLLTAKLPPFTRLGGRFTVRVSSIGDATDLSGGTLLMSALKGPDGKIYATAQGVIETAPDKIRKTPAAAGATAGGAKKGNKPQATSGRLSDGGLVVRNVPVVYNGRKHLWINLDKPSFLTASRVVRGINADFAGSVATAEDAGTVDVRVPDGEEGNVVAFMARILSIEVTPDSRPLIVINQETGTIVIGRGVRVYPCAVSQKNLSVKVGGKSSGRNGFSRVERSVTLRSIVRALNQLGTGTRDMIAILLALKEAGAMDATIRVIG